MINCPLCNSNKYFTIKDFSINQIKDEWIKGFGFNPFEKDLNYTTISKFKCIDCSLIFYNPLIIGKSDLYTQLSDNPLYYEDEKWEFEEALNIIQINKPKSLLEIGCGNGNFLKKVRTAIEDIYGIDINQSAIDDCLNNGINASTETLKNITKKFDCIVLFEVLEHIEDFNTFFNKVSTLLNSNGIFIVATPNPISYLKYIDISILDLPPHHSSGWNYQSFEFVANKYGFDIVNYLNEPLRYIHYLSYIKQIIPEQNNIIVPNTYKRKIFVWFQGIFSDMFKLYFEKIKKIDYQLYLTEKKELIGQTHLVVFKKIVK